MSIRKSGSQISGFVHVANDPLDWDVPDSLPEEELLDGRVRDGPQSREEKEETAETEGLSGVGRGNVAAERELGLVLQVDCRRDITKSSS